MEYEVDIQVNCKIFNESFVIKAGCYVKNIGSIKLN